MLQLQADAMIFVKNRLGKFYEQSTWQIFTNVWEISTNIWEILTNVFVRRNFIGCSIVNIEPHYFGGQVYCGRSWVKVDGPWWINWTVMTQTGRSKRLKVQFHDR